jgi:type III secretion protein C
MTPCSRFLPWILGLLALGSAGAVRAESAPWPEVPFKYYARQYPLPRVLHDFANTFGLELQVSPQVEGQVTGDYAAETPTQFLNALSASYGLDWYYQDGVLNVMKSIEWMTRVLHVGTSTSDVGALKAELTSLGIFEPRFGWAEFPERGVVIVAGPPSYVNEIASIVAALGTAPSDGRQIRIFRLDYARAEDYAFTYHDQRIVTPGVATLLRNLAAGSFVEQQYSPTTGPLSVAPSAAPTLTPLATLPAAPGILLPPDPETGVRTPASPGPAAGNGDTAPARTPNSKVSVHAGLVLTPVIEADPRLNAVIVYDAPEKMPIYEALIHQLDAGRPQIQIEAMIVDVDTDAVGTLGVDWETRIGDVKFGFGQRNNQATILSIDSDSFVARLHALTVKGHARILGRPSILTVDNLAAVLSLSETVYARVSGGGGVGGGGASGGAAGYGGLVPIGTGTLLKVIPRLVEDGGRRDVSLAVEIEDGQIHQTLRKDTLPSVTQSNINTQAVVHEDDSLLIGGYFMDKDSDEEERVPGLSGIPLIGGLFRDKHKEHERSERLFLIRPHVIAAPPVVAAAAPAPELAIGRLKPPPPGPGGARAVAQP